MGAFQKNRRRDWTHIIEVYLCKWIGTEGETMKYGIAINGKFALINEDENRIRKTITLCMPQYSAAQIKTYDDSEVEQGHDGNWYEKGHAPQRPLEEIKVAKLIELGTAFEKASQTAHCLSSAGFEINADEKANRNIEGLVLVLKPEESTLFRSYDNSFHKVTKEQLEMMRKEIAVNSQRLCQIKWQIEAAIDVAETLDELNAINVAF